MLLEWPKDMAQPGSVFSLISNNPSLTHVSGIDGRWWKLSSKKYKTKGFLIKRNEIIGAWLAIVR